MTESEFASRSGRKYSELPFGFQSEAEFIRAAEQYRVEVQSDLDSLTPEDLKNSSERLREVLSALALRCQEEMANLETWLQNPTLFYQFVSSIYSRLIELEVSGKDETEIALAFLEDHSELDQILAIGRFLEHGMGQIWGYRFAQILFAVRVRQ